MDEGRKPGSQGRSGLLVASLAFPIAAVLLFHAVNLTHYSLSSSFFVLPFRFVSRINEFSIQTPEDFFGWMFRTLVGLGAPGLLGAGLLARARVPLAVLIAGAFPVGIGPVGCLLEWAAMAGWFSTPVIWFLYGSSALAGGLLLFTLPRPYLSQPVAPTSPPASRLHRRVIWICFGLLAGFSFLHAVFYPPNYWDALIYYLYYAKLVFLEEGIPFPVDSDGFAELVQAQVGLGLGANYAHLFLFWQAATCKAFGAWSSFPGQWMAPVAGLGAALLLRRTAADRWRSETVGLWAMLLLQSTPYWLFYQNWESDYPLAVWLTTAAVGLIALRSGDEPGVGFHRLIVLICIAVAGSHLNYLMVSLWWFPLVYFLHQRTLWRRWIVWTAVVVGLAASSTWFIRNIIVTGNPVYAFFPEIFGGKNVDLSVLASCEVEWTMNGDGLIGAGPTLWQRILGTPYYFLLDANTHIKWAALPLGWILPGLLFAFRPLKSSLFRWGVGFYAGLLLFYEYAVSPLYLYHILPALPLLVLAACPWMAALASRTDLRRLHSAVVIVVSLTIGLPAALLGAKLASPGLEHTLRPGMDPPTFLRAAVGEYAMWERMNARLPEGAVILTHENRHYYLRDDLKLIHLDDYRLIPFYGKSEEEVEGQLRRLGVGYYLHVANERNHPILKNLGIERLLDDRFVLLSEHGEARLYRLAGEGP